METVELNYEGALKLTRKLIKTGVQFQFFKLSKDLYSISYKDLSLRPTPDKMAS